MIVITSKTEGFRRCGVAHSAQPTEYPDDRFSDEELEILMSEPMLFVETGGKGRAPAEAKDDLKKRIVELEAGLEAEVKARAAAEAKAEAANEALKKAEAKAKAEADARKKAEADLKKASGKK